VALAACGSSGPTKSQYVAKAQTICANAKKQTEPLIRQITASAGALVKHDTHAITTIGTSMGQLHGIAATTLEKLRKLKQPSGDHAAIERFLTPFAGVTSALGHAATSLTEDQSQQAFATLEQLRPVSQEARSGAQAFGLAQCKTMIASLD